MWEQKARTSKKEWKWQRGIVAHPLSESRWNRGHFTMTKWESEKHKSWCTQPEGFLLPRTARCWEALASGEHVVVQWYSWITLKRWGPCMGCNARCRQTTRFSEPLRGRSRRLFMPAQESDWTSQGARRQQRNN